MDDSNRKLSVEELSRTSEQVSEVKNGIDALYQDTIAPVDGIAPGAILSERYEVLEFLGKGGMDTVYKARHTLIGNIVAIKVLHPHLVKDGASRERFKSEAKAAIGLRHERLMAVTDYGVTPLGEPFIVMEFVNGIGLDELLEEKKFLSTEEFFEIFPQICDGLAHVHAKGVVHRDIKPGNIMLSKTHHEKWMVHIVDFGIAKVLPSGKGAVQHLTQTGEIFGSPLYMSPEQCKGREVDARSDMYSLGCVMFEALTGSPPHHGESAIETLMLHVNEKAPKLTDRRAGIDEGAELEKIVAGALDAAPDLRYQTMNQLKADLEKRKFSGLKTVSSSASSGAVTIGSPSTGSTPNKSGANKSGTNGSGNGSNSDPSRNWTAQPAVSAPRTFKNTFLSPLIIIAAAGLTVWLMSSLGITQPRVPTMVNSGDDQIMQNADLEFQLAKEKAAQGFTREAAEYSQKALDLRLKYAPNSLVLAESMNQRADIALHDAQHETLMLQGTDAGQKNVTANVPSANDVARKDDSLLSSRKTKIADEYALAETLLKEAIKIADAKTVGSEKSSSPVRYRSNLATAYLDQDKFKDAETILNEMSNLFFGNQPTEKADPQIVQTAFHDLFDAQYERLYWGTNRPVEAAKLRIAHHPGEGKYDASATISDAEQPFTGQWYFNTFSLDLKQEGKTLSGSNEIRNFGFEPETEHKNTVTGTVEGNVAHLSCTSVSQRDQQLKAIAVRMANVLVFHVVQSVGGLEEGYVPDNAIMDSAPPKSEDPPLAPAPPPPSKSDESPTAVES